MDVERKDKVVGWLQLQGMTTLDSSCNESDTTKDAIEVSPLCRALSQALDGSAKHYNLACQQLSRGLDAHLADDAERAGIVVRYLLLLAGRLDPTRHAELARLLLTAQPPCRLLDEAGIDRYWRFCLALASRQPDLRQLAIESAIGWFYPAGAAAGGGELDTDRRQFRLAHSLLEALAAAFPSTAPAAICDQAESRCLWGRPTRQLACYLLNLFRAAATYLAGQRIRLLFTACRTVAKLECRPDEPTAIDGGASCPSATPSSSSSSTSCLDGPEAADLACRVSVRPPGDWELSAEFHRLLSLQLCRACDQRQKLNAALHLLLCHVRADLAAGEWRRTRALYKDLLTVFDRDLAHQTGPTRLHLLLALVCSASDRIAHGFLDYLWKRAIDTRAGAGHRLRCLALLGDLCARCAFVHTHLLQTVLLLLADYTKRLAARYDKQAGTLATDEAGMFHACVRAFVRIAVRRHRDLLGGGGGSAFLAGTHFHLVLGSSLRPWPALPADLRAEFVHLCRSYRLDAFDAVALDAEAEAAAAAADAIKSPPSTPQSKRKRRRTTLTTSAAEAAATAALVEEDPLATRLDDLSLTGHLLRPLLLPDVPLPLPVADDDATGGGGRAPTTSATAASAATAPASLAPSSDAVAATAVSAEPPQLSLAEALRGPREVFASRRRRLRSDCVVFGESA